MARAHWCLVPLLAGHYDHWNRLSDRVTSVIVSSAQSAGSSLRVQMFDTPLLTEDLELIKHPHRALPASIKSLVRCGHCEMKTAMGRQGESRLACAAQVRMKYSKENNMFHRYSYYSSLAPCSFKGLGQHCTMGE